MDVIQERIPQLQMPQDEGELAAVGWISGTTGRAADVLEFDRPAGLGANQRRD